MQEIVNTRTLATFAIPGTQDRGTFRLEYSTNQYGRKFYNIIFTIK